MTKKDSTQNEVTLESDFDAIYSFEETPIPPELKYLEKGDKPFNIQHTWKLTHVQLREKVLYTILPDLTQMMSQHNDVDIEFAVRMSASNESIRIMISSYGAYSIKTEGIDIPHTRKWGNDVSSNYFYLNFKSKVALIDFIGRVLARYEFRILLTICEYYKEVQADNLKAIELLRTI